MRRILKTAFPDELTKFKSKSKHYSKNAGGDFSDNFLFGFKNDDRNQTLSGWKKILFASLILIAFFGLFTRLIHLQVVNGGNSRELADSNRIQIRIIHAPRGVIYDRNGKILAQNEPGFRLTASSSGERTRYISREEALKMEITGDSNIKNLEIDNLRSYPNGEKTAHILGYVGEINKEELSSGEYKASSSGFGYKAGDKIGRGGVEQVYEKVLKGVDGGEVIEVDSAGNKIRTLRESRPIPGNNIYLTIDVDLQLQAFADLKLQIEQNTHAHPCCGALVASDPNTGQVLSLLSYPSFNPNDLSQALVDSNSPLLNRVISGTYPPGSTYKIISSLAGLESGKITPSTQFEDNGVMHLGPYSFANWYFTEYGRVEGMVDLKKALQRSNDIYFYNLGAMIGEDALAKASRQFGLGAKTGIDLPGEMSGVIADGAWKKQFLKEIWYPGDTLHTAIGQGFTLTTPLQILNMTSIIASDGQSYPLHLVQKITSPDNRLIKEYRFDSSRVKDISSENLKIVKDALSLVPKLGGTAWTFFNFSIPTSGKTGTAEFGDPQGRTHAWYTSYAPVDNPQIALTVLVEAGGEGSTEAGTVARDVYRYYFSPDKTKLEKFESTVVATQSARTLGE